MSRGPGRIERAIRALFDAHPDLAFVTDDLCEHCYPGEEVEKKHRVAVLRAAWAVLKNDPDWRAWRGEGMGGGAVFFSHASVQSYALARHLVDSWTVYRSPKRARREPGEWVRAGPGFRRKVINDHRRIIPDRAALPAGDGHAPEQWVKWVGFHNAWRDGDAETRAAVDAARAAFLEAEEREGCRLAFLATGRPNKYFQAGDVARLETHTVTIPASLIASLRTDLAQIAAALRALAERNDPDAQRAGMVQIAGVLDAITAPATPL